MNEQLKKNERWYHVVIHGMTRQESSLSALAVGVPPTIHKKSSGGEKKTEATRQEVSPSFPYCTPSRGTAYSETKEGAPPKTKTRARLVTTLHSAHGS